MTGPTDTPEGAELGAPTEDPTAGGDQPGQPHPVARPYSPLGGPLGPMVGLDTIRDAVEHTFQTRIAAYVREAGATRPHITNPPLADFHDWENTPPESAARPGQQPRYVITVPGVLGAPRRKGDGTYAVTFLVRVQLWLWGKDWRNATDRLGAYLVATRTCLLQNPSLGGVARSTRYRGETIAPFQQVGTHSWAPGTLEVEVFVDPAANAYAGPAPLDPDRPIDVPKPITEVGVTVTGEPVGY